MGRNFLLARLIAARAPGFNAARIGRRAPRPESLPYSAVLSALLWLALPAAHAGAAMHGDQSCLAVGDVTRTQIVEEVLARVPGGYDSIGDYELAIHDMRSAHGQLYPDLFPLLLGAGLAYQENGQHDDAAQALWHALFVVRANEGLYSLTQIPILELLIDSRTMLGDWRGVADAHDLLIWVYRRNYGPDDPRLLPALKQLRRWNFEAYNKETGRTLDILFHDAGLYYKQGIRIVEKCTDDHQAALCFWHKGCCPGAETGYCPEDFRED